MMGPTTAKFLRISAKLMHSLMGGFALFCLYYAAYTAHLGLVPFAWYLMKYALLWGGLASAVLYFQLKYLDD